MMKKIIFLVMLSLFLSCGSIQVERDYDASVSFQSIKTYNYMPDMETGLSDLDLNRLIDAIDAELNGLGWSKSASPDVMLNLFSETYEEASRNTVGVGIGGGGRNMGVSVGAGIPVGSREVFQKVIVDLVDTSRDVLIWQAIGEGKIKFNAAPEQRRAFFQNMANKLFEEFPPEAK